MRHELVVSTLRFCRIFLLLGAIGACLPSRAFAATDAEPCATNTEIRQLDYWLGNWSIGNAAASDHSTSKVSLSLDNCMFVEHWENGKGHATQKMFAYSPEDKNWYGMFADNEGRVHVFLDGKVSSGTAEFHGPSRGPSGEVVLNRLKVARLSANQIEEVWEKSTDNGAHWTTAYRAEYSRANP
jgi:hypothetical protein